MAQPTEIRGRGMAGSPEITRFEQRSIRPHFQVEGELQALVDLSSLDGMLLRVCIALDDGYEPIGTAVLVAPGVALTAKHLFTEREGLLEAKLAGVTCVGAQPGGLQLWAVRQITYVDASDIALLELDFQSRDQPEPVFSLAHLTTRGVNIGEPLYAVGLIAADPFVPMSELVTLTSTFLASHGPVTEWFLPYRDTVMLPGPCFSVASQTFGSMSGGPVFDADGFLVGLISTGYEGAGGPTFVSPMHQALVATFDCGWPGQWVNGADGLINTALSKADIERPEAMVVDRATGRYEVVNWLRE